MTLEEAQKEVDKWIKTYGVRSVSYTHLFHLDTVYYYIYIFLLYINSASIGQSQHCLFAYLNHIRCCLNL